MDHLLLLEKRFIETTISSCSQKLLSFLLKIKQQMCINQVIRLKVVPNKCTTVWEMFAAVLEKYLDFSWEMK